MFAPLSRREFLSRTTSAAAAAVMLPRLVQAPGMFISLNGAVTPGIGPWPEAARLAARLGYGGIDWSVGPAKAAGLEATKALFAELKIKPTITNLPMPRGYPFGGDDAGFQAALEPLAADAAFAAAIGCQKMMVVLSPASALPKEDQRRLVVARIGAVAEVLQKSNIRLGMEFLGPLYMRTPAPPPPAPPPATPRIPFIWTLPETVALAKDCGANVGAVLDVWHWHHAGSTVADIIAAGKSRIVHVHVSDAKPMAPEDVRDNMRVLPGEGAIDLSAFFQALKQIGYDGGVSPEPLGRFPPGTTADDAAKQAFDATAAVMKKAGL